SQAVLFFFQAEDGIRDFHMTGVQTCALPIYIGENIIENNSLQAEISNNINLGFKVGPYKIDKHKVSVGANGFIRDTKDRIVRRSNTRINDAEQTAPFENLSSTKSKGFEIELNYEFNQRFILFANLSRFNTVYSKK